MQNIYELVSSHKYRIVSTQRITSSCRLKNAAIAESTFRLIWSRQR